MALTNFKISMSEYKRLVEKDAKMAGDGTVYGIFLSNLFNLTNLTEKYFTRDENGNLPILKAEDYKSLIDSYGARIQIVQVKMRIPYYKFYGTM